MAWTELTRRQHDRVGDKYASDLNDAEWALIAPLMPPTKTSGRPRTPHLRDLFDAILYISVTSRTVVWQFLEHLRFEFVPVLHRLQGGSAAQG
jgi:hypothetical protein